MDETCNLWRSLVFTLAESVGRIPLSKIQREFENMPAAWASGRAGLAQFLDRTTLGFVLGAAGRSATRQEIERARRLGVTLLADGNRDYPENLAMTQGRPPVLYVRGVVEAVRQPAAVAVVGSRRCSDHGSRQARDLARSLADHGVVVHSGLAFGIDAAAHGGVLGSESPGRTVATLASGVDKITPRTHERLGHAILEAGGAIVSEFPLGTEPRKGHFPRRNRVISGLALGVVVIEAPEKSGALITAATALEQDREVMALPAAVDSPHAAGCNALIREGAQLVRHAEDVLDSVPALAAWRAALASRPRSSAAEDAGEDVLVQALARGPVSLDGLCQHTGQEAGQVVARIVALELEGIVDREGALYCLRT